MRIPRSRGAVSGLLLMVLGAWGALVPFIGPYFDVSIGTDSTWDWSSGRLWLSVIPGAVTFLGGLWLMSSAHRANAGLGAWLAILAGAWFVVGPEVSRLWNDGVSAAGDPIGGTNRQVLEVLVSYYALGAVIVALGAFALGRLAVRSVRDAELAREAELERERAARDERAPRDERFGREPAERPAAERPASARPVAERAPSEGSATERPASDRPAPEPVAARSERPTSVERPAPAPAAEEPTRVSQTRPTATSPSPSGARTTPPRSGGLLGRFRRS